MQGRLFTARGRSRVLRPLIRVAAVVLIVTGCSEGVDPVRSDITMASAPAAPGSVPVAPSDVATTTTSTTLVTSPSSLAQLVEPLGSAIHDPEPPEVIAPVTLSIPALGVDRAPIVPVGVLDNGEMEIPDRSEVGWYRFGPSPGGDGSAVLAAHIAVDNRPGVFRHLADLEVGAEIDISLADGSTMRASVVETAQYAKSELPAERVFARQGDPVITLITCGGEFNRSLRSYEDNVVVYAVPNVSR